MATTIQAKHNPDVKNEDGFMWIGIRQDDLQVTEVKDAKGNLTGRKLKFHKSHTATEVAEGKSFVVVGEAGEVGGLFGGISKKTSLIQEFIDPNAQQRKAEGKMLEAFNKALKEHSLLVTEKTVRKDGVSTKVPIVIKDREVITLAHLDQWEKARDRKLLDTGFSPLGRTFEQLLKADEMNPDGDKRGSWFQGYLKIKQQLGQSNPENYLDSMIQLVKAGASQDELIKAAEKAKADIAAQKESKKKAKLVKSEANLAAQAEFERLKEEARQVSEELTEQSDEGMEVEEAA